MNFTNFGLTSQILKAIDDMGYQTPTPIQQHAIPYILQGRDVFACAQTGTGKTASFTLPIIDILAASRQRNGLPRVIILEPTRELAHQVYENFVSYTKYLNLKAVILVGGESMFGQDKILKKGVDVLIATPGRLLDLFERGKLIFTDLKTLVIDEADRMLDMGFIPDIEQLASLLPRLRQTLLFSATMSDEIKDIATKYLINPKTISVSKTNSTAETVEQFIFKVEVSDKRKALRAILHQQEENSQTIVFCNRKRDVNILTSSLKRHGFLAGGLHGDLTQHTRNDTLDDFRNGKLRILVASDVAARGIDVQGLNLVVNFDVPLQGEDYVHRIGRTGRAGKGGQAITLVTKSESKKIKAVERIIAKQIPSLDLNIEESKPAIDMDIGDHEPTQPIIGFGAFTPAFMRIDPLQYL
ncbi:MAG TPA: DEAD/DEAH box helicase [Candidatus Nitrosotenuis sp.]|jgi:superfamily II DNA/RNA helicase|nr:DEAD/DEAH box helicase [Candidatus Nitrosotenuis sp.]